MNNEPLPSKVIDSSCAEFIAQWGKDRVSL